MRAKKAAAGTAGRTAASPQNAKDAEVSARSSTHAAWVAAGAAVLAALLALIGSSWSAERAARTAAQNVITEQSGETERSRAEFLRLQQKDLYVDVVADLQKLKNAQKEYAGMAFNPQKPANLNEGKERYDATYGEFMDDQNGIRILGSKPAQQAFMRLMDAHLKLHNNYIFLVNLRSNSWSSFKIPDSLQQTIEQAFAESQVAEDNFVMAAQHDMGL
jgi:hypothetical protein